MAIWAKRYGKEGLKIASNQESTWKRLSISSTPAGVCIQLLADKIQNEESSVPTATMQVAKKCRPFPTRFRPNNMIPRNPASRKKADKTS